MKKKKFAEGLCREKIFFVFIIGCLFGCFYEECLTFYFKLVNDQPLFWELRRGVIFEPYSPVYGLGAILMTIVLIKDNRPLWKTFLYASLLGGGTEYVISFLQETFIGTVSWDYSHKFLNIAGRTTIPFMLFWGLLGIVFVKIIYPCISDLIEKLPIKIGQMIFVILATLFICDATISWTALYRQTLRRKDVPAKTIVGKFYDKYFDDKFLKKYFGNMVVSEEKP